MKLISWNVNGLRACVKKGFLDFLSAESPDIICLQETKMEPGQADFDLEGYLEYWNSAEKKGYSGTAVFTKQQPLTVRYGMGIAEHDHEGRLITLEYPSFFLVCCYTPNAQRGLTRLDYRMQWEDDLRRYLLRLDQEKPVVYCGDLNVAHREIDLKNAKSNQGNAGFTQQERAKLSQLLACGFVDSFRHFYPDLAGAYSWWSYQFNARSNNTGWRIDYIITSKRLISRASNPRILSDVLGSDHCPVSLELS